MGKAKKRASSTPKSGDASLLDQGRVVAEAVFKDLQKRLPPDLAKQVEKAVGQSHKTVQGGLKTLQTRLDKTARQADVDKLTKRIDALSKQLERVLSGRPAARTSAASSSTTR